MTIVAAVAIWLASSVVVLYMLLVCMAKTSKSMSEFEARIKTMMPGAIIIGIFWPIMIPAIIIYALILLVLDAISDFYI